MSIPDSMGHSSKNRKETANQRYIRLLSQLAGASDAMETNESDSHQDLLGFEELLTDGFITGHRSSDSVDAILGVYNMRITARGRLFLDELKKKQELNTSVGLIKHNRFWFYKWIIGVIFGGIIGFYLKQLLAWLSK